jgi:GT2 family glycosyltransferase
MKPAIHHPKVSIISINYNGAAVTCELLESLKKVTYPDFEVIVVDNASKENPDSIYNNHPWIKFISSEVNLGFAGGNNLGLNAATGDYFLLLNNDTEVDPGFLEPIVQLMENDKTIGVASPKIIFHHSHGIIQFAGFNPINPYTGRGTSIGFGQKDIGQYNASHETSRAHGAAMMISRRAVEKVGLMADLFFLYYEEMDYCERIKKAGFSIWYEAGSTIYHKESMSTGKGSTLKTYYLTRNRLLYQRRNVQGFQLLFSILFFTLISIPKNSIQYLLKGKIDMLKAFWKGVLWNITARDIHRNESLT